MLQTILNWFKPAYPSIQATALNALIKNGERVKILDVRSPGELSSGTIKGYQNINVFDSKFQEKVGKLDREQMTVVYCQSGRRSAMACRMMTKMGFKDLHNLKGGMMAWKRM